MYIYTYIHITYFDFIYLPDINMHQLNFCSLPSQYIYVLRNTLTIHIGHFNKRRQTDGLTVHMEFQNIWLCSTVALALNISWQSGGMTNLL